MEEICQQTWTIIVHFSIGMGDNSHLKVSAGIVLRLTLRCSVNKKHDSKNKMNHEENRSIILQQTLLAKLWQRRRRWPQNPSHFVGLEVFHSQKEQEGHLDPSLKSFFPSENHSFPLLVSAVFLTSPYYQQSSMIL